jgi:transposase
MVTRADVQDRRGGKALLWLLHQRFVNIQLTWADGGYSGKIVVWCKARFDAALEIVKRSDDTSGFRILPRRWVVERTFSWFMKCRRMTADYERLPETSVAMAQIVMIGVMVRRLTAGR